MNSKFHSLSIFEQSDSAIAIHARRRWMNGGKRDGVLAGRILSRRRRQQSGDGSWAGSVAKTIENLFAIWLLDEHLSHTTAKAIDWMLEVGHPAMHHECGDGAAYDSMFFRMARGERESLREMSGVPFTQGCAGFIKTGAALFFATAFGHRSDLADAAYDSLSRVVQVRQGRWCSPSCGNNILQAFAIHETRSTSAAMKRAVAWLATQQEESGAWGSVPFYPTVFAMGHLKDASSRRQLRAAMRRLQRLRNPDGSWGRSQRELNTLLALDAMERSGI
jgi:hypothetical protein